MLIFLVKCFNKQLTIRSLIQDPNSPSEEKFMCQLVRGPHPKEMIGAYMQPMIGAYM